MALLLDNSFFAPQPGLAEPSPEQPSDTVQLVKVLSKPEKKHKIVVPLGLQSIPTVSLHKGGGKIIIKPNDVGAALRLAEVREALVEGDRIRRREEATQNVHNNESAKLSLLQKIEVIPGVGYKDLSLADRAYTLLGGGWEQHTISRVLKSFGLEVQLSPTLANWLKKEERRIKRELTPILLPEVLDSRPLFEKVEAGMVLECQQNFAFDKETIFRKDHRYQVVDTARTAGQDGVVKIFKTPISPGIKLIVNGDNTFDWTAFHGEMEQTFHYEEKVIYDESKCVPAQYPELVQYYRKRLQESGLDKVIFNHIVQDAPQMATKRDVVDGKLMRMGKTVESATVVWLWGSRKCAWIGPRNARIFTQRELDTLGKTVPAFKNYVVVDQLSDLQKPGDIYLMTYSWLKKMNDPQRQNRKQGKSLLRFTRREKGLEVINEHPCPHCGVPLVRPYIHKVCSDDILGQGKTVLWRAEEVEWKKDGGYVCTNPQCVRKYDNRKCKGTAWYSSKVIRTQGFDIQSVDKQGQPVTKHLNYWTDLSLKVHARCNQQSVKGRVCTECGLVDGAWVPPLYKRCKDSFASVVVDEIHTIKSADSDVGRAVRSFRGRHHVGITGTLIPNTPSDTYWPLHWNFHAGSASFPYQGKGGATQYYDDFCEYVTIKRGNNLSDSRKMLPYLKNPIKFWEMMAPKMVRRNYEDPLVLESLAKAGLHMPKTRIHKISCDLDPLQASLMVASINNFEIQYNEMSAEAAQSHHLLNPALVLSQMSRMRIAATCPEHFNKVLAKQGQPPIYHGPLCGGKLKDIKNLVLQKTMGGKKVFILSGFIATRESLGKELAEFEPIVFNNKWDDDERREAFDLFRNDPERRIFIAGTLEIREGIDMSAADAVICTDLLWQPGLQCQAWSRILTPTNQERNCDVYLLLAKSTVDEHIYNTFYAKVAAAEQALDRKVINVRAESMDIRWFVSRVLDDRARIIEAVREAGEELVLTPAIQAVEVEERVL